ncbi:MAG: hypothetical protein ACKVX9_17845 [Blastocatellia bacterium]
MRSKNIVLLLSLALVLATSAPSQSKSASPRAAVQSFFNLLKSQKYDALYDFLPSDLQWQMTREQLAMSLKRLDAFLVIERLEIGRVQERKDFAVVDTTIYGKLRQPMKINEEEIREGRVSGQQFLHRESGVWKVATADNRSQSFFLKRNPEFDEQFQLTRPKFEFRRNGQWAAMGPKRQ